MCRPDTRRLLCCECGSHENSIAFQAERVLCSSWALEALQFLADGSLLLVLTSESLQNLGLFWSQLDGHVLCVLHISAPSSRQTGASAQHKRGWQGLVLAFCV